MARARCAGVQPSSRPRIVATPSAAARPWSRASRKSGTRRAQRVRDRARVLGAGRVNTISAQRYGSSGSMRAASSRRRRRAAPAAPSARLPYAAARRARTSAPGRRAASAGGCGPPPGSGRSRGRAAGEWRSRPAARSASSDAVDGLFAHPPHRRQLAARDHQQAVGGARDVVLARRLRRRVGARGEQRPQPRVGGQHVVRRRGAALEMQWFTASSR